MERLEWADDDTFRVRDVTFHLSIYDRFKSSRDNFLLVKHRHMVNRYLELLADLRPTRFIELGICEGGSTAFFALMTEPERFVAVDLKDNPTIGLEEFIDEHRLRDRVHTHYSIDQADQSRLRDLALDEFGDDPLDMVIDDASHLLEPTRASFNVLFPRLKPGGVFVIEDWSKEQHIDMALEARAREDPAFRAEFEEVVRTSGQPAAPLTVLLFELVLASAYVPLVFGEVFVSNDWAYCVRGPGEVDPATFDVSSAYSAPAGRLIPRHG